MRWKLRPLRLLSFVTLYAAGIAFASTQVSVTDKDGKPLANAVIFLESPSAKAAAKPLSGVEIIQIAKQFSPQIAVVTPNTSVLFPNKDTVRHHVYSFSPAKKFELKLYSGVPAAPVVFDKPGVAVLGCNIHDNMVAWVLIVETPYFGVTDGKGRLTLDAPAGNYQLKAWHSTVVPGSPLTEQPVKITPGNDTLSVKVAGSTA
ncbi:Methylamine utilization protein MauL [Comamonadaceae bacterium]